MKILEEFLKDMKRLSKQGRCLHFDAGERCDQIINAHSIQKSGQLKKIAEDGHVIRLSGDTYTLQKTDGKLRSERIGWNDVSTFTGFCKKHDNTTFEIIDNLPLHPTDEQIFLYSYRSLCREYFVKENAVDLLLSFKKNHNKLDDSVKGFLEAAEHGHTLGFNNLKEHKKYFDKSLSNKIFSDISYVCFVSKDKWNIQLSGVVYPDFDFNGNYLQDPANHNIIPQLIAYFTAPMESGWAFVFAWHASSQQVGRKLLSSLAEHYFTGNSLADAIFRFTFSCCENHALRPSWWDSIGKSNQSLIIARSSLMADPAVPVPPNYLTLGLERIANCDFETVIDNSLLRK